MPTHIERMLNEPILIALLTGKLTPEDIYRVYDASAQMADDLGVPIYRLTVVDTSDISFSGLVEVMAKASHGQPGSPSDSRIISVIVGRPGTLAQLYSDGMRQEQYGRRNVPFFESRDEAMTYLRQQMAKHAAVS